MKRLLVSYRYQIFFAQTSAETYCSTQRIWQSDQFPPLFFAIEKKVCRFLTASKSYLQSCQRKSFKIKVFWSFLLICFYLCVVWSRFFFLRTQRAILGGPSRCIEYCMKVHRKFSRGLWKKVSPQKVRFCQNILTSFQLHFFTFLSLSFFSKAPRNLYVHSTDMFEIFERCS